MSNNTRQDELIAKMKATKEKWDAEALNSEDGPDETDALLSKAIEMAIEQGKGWKEGEREAYIEKLLDDDFIPPLFATNQEELDKSGLGSAFSSLMYDDPPAQTMSESKKKGNEAFLNGKNNVAGNMQYFRDAVNHYYEAFFWAEKVDPGALQTDSEGKEIMDSKIFTEAELSEWKSTILANAAMAHMQLKNWGYVRDNCRKSLEFNDTNIKAWYRLAKAYQMLQDWEEAGDAIDSGLLCDNNNNELLKLQKALDKKVRRARLERQKRERARAERVSNVKKVWKHCKESQIVLGRVPLVASVTDDEEEDDEVTEARWHHHHPHTGRLPQQIDGEWAWPAMFVYPSHNQSDFIENFFESDMIAIQMARVFPEVEDDVGTTIPWDYNNEFECSNLAVYFEVHCTDSSDMIHPDYVEKLKDQGATMKFYESSRALKGDEGEEFANLARLIERKHLHEQRKRWKKEHGSLWSTPGPCPVVRVHPAANLKEVLLDARMVVPNFLVTFILFPDSHPAHQAFLKEHKCLGIIQAEE